jgi:hypothetical protein
VQPGPVLGGWKNGRLHTGRPVPENFRYSSENNERWLTLDDLREIVHGYESTHAPLRAAVG